MYFQTGVCGGHEHIYLDEAELTPAYSSKFHKPTFSFYVLYLVIVKGYVLQSNTL